MVFAAGVWLAAIAAVRALAAGFGGDARATATLASALLAGAAAGSLAGWRPSRRAAAAAALGAMGVGAAAARLESQLSWLTAAAGDEWRPDIVVFLIGLLGLGLPAAIVGKWISEGEAPSTTAALLGAPIALALLDAPWIPEVLSAALGWAAPLLLVLARGAPAAAREAAPQESGARPRLAAAALAAGAAAVVCALAPISLELRSFLRGTAWDLARSDATLLLLMSLGTALLGPILARGGPIGGTAAPALAAALLLLGSRRLEVLHGDPQLFRDVTAFARRTLGAAGAIDAPLYPSFLVAATVPAFLLALGCALGGLVKSCRAGARTPALSLGLAAGLWIAMVSIEGRSVEGAIEGGLPRAFDAALVLLAGASILAAAAVERTPRRIVAIALSLVCAGGLAAARAALPAEFRPTALFSTQERAVPEFHKILAVRESLDGLAALMEEPDWWDLTRPERSRRVRVDRVDRTPTIQGRHALDLALAQALAVHGAPERVLILGVLPPESLDLLRAAGVKWVDFAPMPATAAAVATGFDANDLSPAGRDGLRFAAGRRGYDVVFWAPQPNYPAAVASALRATHLRALESALRPGGLAAVCLDLETTPAPVIDALREDWLGDRPGAAVAFAATGVESPAVGLLVSPAPDTKKTGIPTFLAALRARVPALATEVAWIAPPAPRAPDALRASSYFTSLLPPIAPLRAFESLGHGTRFSPEPRRAAAEGGALVDRWYRDAPAGPAKALSHLARASQTFFAAPWSFNPFRSPAEQIPIPNETLDAIVASARVAPGAVPPAAEAFRRLARFLIEQKEFQRLLGFSKAFAEAAPGIWDARIALARAHRELLDPEAALAILSSPSPPTVEGDRIAVAIETAAIQYAMKNEGGSIATLQAAFREYSTSGALAEALAKTLLAMGKPAEALPYGNHFETLSRGSAAARVLKRQIERAIERAASKPGGGH